VTEISVNKELTFYNGILPELLIAIELAKKLPAKYEPEGLCFHT
jgi:hypothetical protein